MARRLVIIFGERFCCGLLYLDRLGWHSGVRKRNMKIIGIETYKPFCFLENEENKNSMCINYSNMTVDSCKGGKDK